MSKWYEIVRKNAGLAEMLVYGVIGLEDKEIKASDFVRDLRNLEKNYPVIRVRINCYGGDPDEGLPMYNAMVQSSSQIITVNEGIAASWGAMLFQGGALREMASNARFMTHQAMATVKGANADKLREIAQDVERINKIMIDIMKKRTKQDEKTIKSWFVAGVDRFFSAEECLSLNICDKIIEPVANIQAKWDEEPSKIVAEFNKYLNNTYNKMNKELLIQALGLSVNATDAEILAAVTSLKNKEEYLNAKISKLEAESNTHKSEKIEAVLSAAISSKKIVEAQKPIFKALLEADFENGKKAIDSITSSEITPVSITAQIGANSKVAANHVKERTFLEWAKEDPSGLENLERTQPEKFKALYRAQYGKEPVLN
jgi:ATP-dependent protease ClpP protease subunit